MCGRYAWSNPQVERFRKYAPSSTQKVKPRYNRAPGQKHPIIKSSKKESSWADAQWGNFPSSNSPKAQKFPINARSETVAEKPTFEESFQQRRCIVPADGYYEWQTKDQQAWSRDEYDGDGLYSLFVHSNYNEAQLFGHQYTNLLTRWTSNENSSPTAGLMPLYLVLLQDLEIWHMR